jgi:PBSX family phage terminase large subunit
MSQKINFNLTKNQGAYLNSKLTNTGFVAGLGSGKSFTATLKTILKKLENPTLTVAYYLPNYSLVKDIAFAKFPEMLSEMGLKYKLNKSDKELFIDGIGGKIVFRSMDNPETIVGYEVFYSIIDECDILKADKMEIAYNKIMARNRQKHPDGLKNQLDVVGTPEGYKWFYKRFITEFRPETDLLVKASTYENKHLPAEYITNLEQQYPPNLLKAYLNGEFVNLNSANIYTYFDRKTHHKSIKLLDYEVIHFGQDFNYNGSISTLFVIRDNIPYMFAEVVSKDTYGVVSTLKDMFPNRRLCCYPDASGNAHKTNATKTDIEILRQGGITVYVNNKNPRVQDRVNSVQALFSHNKLFIDVNNCPKTAEALEQQSYTENGEPEKFSGSATIDDFTDSLGYFVYYKYPLLDRTVKQSTFIV